MRTLHVFFSYTRRRETSILTGELPEESEQFRFFRASRLGNLKDSVGLIVVKASATWSLIVLHTVVISIPPFPPPQWSPTITITITIKLPVLK